VSFRLERQLRPADLVEALRREAREGLTARPKRMRSRWIWDARGSELYERIMELPAYYLPGAERAILDARAGEIAARARPDVLLELGSGSSAKTTVLLDALPRLRRFVAVDVSESALAEAGPGLAGRYPTLEVVGVVGDFERHLPGPSGRTLVVCLGSTIGALEPEDRAALLAAATTALGLDGALLLGVDLVKPVARIEAAYNDSTGLSAALIANLLPILNRELGADFEPERFRSEAAWKPELERMEMAVRSLAEQRVTVNALDLTVDFAAGEPLRTEISTKFRREGVERELAAAGLGLDAWWTDPAGDFAVAFATPRRRRRRRSASRESPRPPTGASA
jgi:L-histidine N-alpha-methyltransferase